MHARCVAAVTVPRIGGATSAFFNSVDYLQFAEPQKFLFSASNETPARQTKGNIVGSEVTVAGSNTSDKVDIHTPIKYHRLPEGCARYRQIRYVSRLTRRVHRVAAETWLILKPIPKDRRNHVLRYPGRLMYQVTCTAELPEVRASARPAPDCSSIHPIRVASKVSTKIVPFFE